MPPKKGKKGQAKEEKVLLGRPGNNVKMGIVGLPNVGKSSFFNALCKMNVPAENFPFCTIDPTEARVPVPDERFDWLVDLYKPKSVVPAVLSVTDIAGLVKGANEGQGLGNEFLSNISAVDGIFHVCRAFPSKDVTHVEGSVDPVRDLSIIHTELRLKDIQVAAGYLEKHARNVERGVGGKEAKANFDIMQKVHYWLTTGKYTAPEEAEAAAGGGEEGGEHPGSDVRAGDWTPNEIEFINTFNFLTAKPMVYLVNLSEKQYATKKSKWLAPIAEYVQSRGLDDKILPFSARFEARLVEADGDEAALAAYAEEIKTKHGAKMRKSAVNKVIKEGYDVLRLIRFFTCGADEVRGWTVRRDAPAPKAAGVIHTDFEKGFICAEVQKYQDLHELGNESAVKAAGKLRTEGKQYLVQDGDIMFFKFNTAGGGKK